MQFTSITHRKLAKRLWQKATKLPSSQTEQMSFLNKSASLHMGLARVQEQKPHLAPAAKYPQNQVPPRQPLSRPRLVSSKP